MGIRRLVVAVALIALGLAGCESATPAKAPESAASAPAAATPPAAPPAPAVTAPAAPPPETPAAPSAPLAVPAVPPAPEQTPVESARVVVIKTSLANFRAAPGTSGRILAVLKKGTRIDVLEARNQWYRVRLADGREGWVAESVTAPAPE